jgi:hypothetical protein
MTPISYEHAVRGSWDGPADEKPAVTGAKFLQTLDALSGIDPLFTDWQINRNWNIAEDGQPRRVPLATVRERIAEIVRKGIVHDDFGEPTPGYGYNVRAAAGVRGPRQASFSAKTGAQSFKFEFGDYYVEPDSSIVTYPLFRAALLAPGCSPRGSYRYCAGCFGLQNRQRYSGPPRPDIPQVDLSCPLDGLPLGGACCRRYACARNPHRTHA